MFTLVGSCTNNDTLIVSGKGKGLPSECNERSRND